MKFGELRKLVDKHEFSIDIYFEGSYEFTRVDLDEQRFDVFEVVSISGGQCGGDPLCVEVKKLD